MKIATILLLFAFAVIGRTFATSWTSTPPSTAQPNVSYGMGANHSQTSTSIAIYIFKNGAQVSGGGNGAGSPTYLTASTSYSSSDSGSQTISYRADGWSNASGTFQFESSVSKTTSVAANVSPSASLSGPTTRTPGQNGTWSFSVSDSNGNLKRWRFYFSTNPNPQWSNISGSSASGTYTNSFSAGTYTMIVDVEDLSGASASTSLTVDVANPSYTLSTSVSPSGAGSVSGGGSYASGSSASISAAPNSGYVFSHWSGGASGSSNPTSVTMNANKSVTANFSPIIYTLSTSVSPSGGGTVSGGGSYQSGSNASVTATANTGYAFSSWSGDATGSMNPKSVTMSSNKSVTANFSPISYTLTVNNGSGGGSHAFGSTFSINATPPTGYHFTSWTKNSGPGSIANSTAASTTFTMGAGNATITANYANDAPLGVLDTASNTVAQNQNLTGSGWAADTETGAPVNHVNIRIDGSTVVQATLGGVRSDVANAYGRPDFTNSGFSFSYNIGTLAGGQHTVDAVAYDNQGASAVLSGSRTFTVSTPPVIVAQPQSQAVSAGADVTLSVTASGATPLSYQWKKNGTSISGATAQTLVLTNVQAASAAGYTVVITNSIGSVTSSSATLTVNPATPTIRVQPVSLSVNAGSAAVFTVDARGTDPLSYQWRKNGSNIGGATAASYTISNAQAIDAAGYAVYISNSVGNLTSATASLTISVAPAFTVQPQTQSVPAGSTVSFTVAASGSPAPTFQWRKNGANLANGGNISGATTSTLTLTNAQPTDTATYNAIATNTSGSATSSNATLTVVVTQNDPNNQNELNIHLPYQY